MIRNLCFAALAVLFVASTSSANFVIDDFSAAGAFSASPSAGFNYVDAPGFQGYEALNVASGSTVSIEYDFTAAAGPGGVVTPGTLASAAYDSFISSGGTNPTVPFPSLTALLIPYAGSPGSAFPIDFSIEDNFGTVLAQGSLSGSPQQVHIGSSLGSVSGLKLSFTNDSAVTLSSFQLGGGSLTAVPEPTSMLMFPAAIGLFMARRRRVS